MDRLAPVNGKENLMEIRKLAAVEFKLPIDRSEIVEFPANP